MKVPVFPELGRLESQTERNRVFMKAMGRLRRRASFWAAAIAVPIGLSLVLTMLLLLVARYVPMSSGLRGGLVGGVIGGTVFITLQFVFRASIRRLIREDLVERGIPICVPCGYDLRGQKTARCPECGAAFDSALLEARSGGPARDGT